MRLSSEEGELDLGAGAAGSFERHSQELPGRETSTRAAAEGDDHSTPSDSLAAERGADGLAVPQQPQLLEGLAAQHAFGALTSEQADAALPTDNIPTSATRATQRRFGW